MLNSKEYPKDSTEYLINEKLGELVRLCKQQIYTKEAQESPEHDTEERELDVLGIIVSKYCEWDGDRIAAVAISAFGDSNYQAEIEY